MYSHSSAASMFIKLQVCKDLCAVLFVTSSWLGGVSSADETWLETFRLYAHDYTGPVRLVYAFANQQNTLFKAVDGPPSAVGNDYRDLLLLKRIDGSGRVQFSWLDNAFAVNVEGRNNVNCVEDCQSNAALVDIISEFY